MKEKHFSLLLKEHDKKKIKPVLLKKTCRDN